MSIDICGLNFTGFNGRIAARVTEIREQGASAQREKFMAEAAAPGLTIDEIVQPPKGKRRHGGKGDGERASA